MEKKQLLMASGFEQLYRDVESWHAVPPARRAATECDILHMELLTLAKKQDKWKGRSGIALE